MKRLLVLAIISLFGVLSLYSPALAADDDPDSVSLYDVRVYKHLIEEDDWLAVVPYSIPYTSEPDLSIDKMYIFRLIAADNVTEIGSKLAFPYINGGYGDGIVSFYFDANSAPAWDTDYSLRVDQNPAAFSTPQNWAFTLSTSSYSNYDTQEGNRALLQANIIAICRDLEVSWDIELLGESEISTVLNEYGEAYFRNSIIGLQSMCPKLFSVEITPITAERRSWDYTFANSFATRYRGTFWANAMTGFGGLFNVDSSPAAAVLSLLLVVIIMGLAIKYLKASGNSALMNGLAALGLFTCLGAFSFTLHGFLSFICAVASGVVLFLNRA